MAGRPCKICKLKKSYPEAHRLITEEISKPKGQAKIKSLLKNLKERFNLSVNSQNVHRHKGHAGINKENNHNTPEKAEQTQKGTVGAGASFSNSLDIVSLPDIEPKHIKFLSNYRQNGYRNKEKAYTDAGLKSPKKVYELMEQPEVQAVLNEMKAIDFIKLKITGNQIIAGLGKVANYTDFIDQMYDDDGRPITNIKLWPEELRCALNAVEMTEDVMKANKDDDGIVVKRKFKFRFESHLKAKQELRKHFMEVELYEKNNSQAEIYEAIIEKLLLNQINPIAAGLEMGKYNLAIPDALKIAMQKVDPKMIKPPKRIDLDDLDVSQLSDEELDQILLREEGI